MSTADPRIREIYLGDIVGWRWRIIGRDGTWATYEEAATALRDAPRGHILTVSKSDDYGPDAPDFDYSIECLNVDKCGGWTVCDEKHEVDGRSASCGPYECDCGGEDGPSCLGDEPGEGNRPRPPWYDQEVFEFHGVVHEWRYGHGWVVPFEGCVVESNDFICDSAYDIALKHGCGRHEVDDEWDDDFDCTLKHVRTLDEERAS